MVPSIAAGATQQRTSTTAYRAIAQVESTQTDALAPDEQTAVTVVDEFWRRYIARAGQSYVPPRVAGGYTGTAGPLCDGQPSPPLNAFYCEAGDFIAWDDQLMAAGYQDVGDVWVYLTIAHEWGHAIQARLAQPTVSIARELQADCLAGAALQGAVNEGLITVDPGDPEEVSRALAVLADDYPWTDVTSHGDAAQRSSAFSSGVSGGVDACL
jgi:predicted metalloprotease